LTNEPTEYNRKTCKWTTHNYQTAGGNHERNTLKCWCMQSFLDKDSNTQVTKTNLNRCDFVWNLEDST
jgi:hypothetical protein